MCSAGDEKRPTKRGPSEIERRTGWQPSPKTDRANVFSVIDCLLLGGILGQLKLKRLLCSLV